MITPAKTVRALQKPERVWDYLRRKGPAGIELLEAGRVPEVLDRFIRLISGRSPYRRYLRLKNGSRYVERQIKGNRMLLDLEDVGISYDLLIYGHREPYSTTIFRRELRRIRRDVDELTVVDVGANIGYYLLQELDLVGPDGHVYAFEPVPENLELLGRNVRLNGYGDRVTIEKLALGERDTRKQFITSNASNLGHVSDVETATEYSPEEASPRGKIEVPVRSLDSYLAEQNVAPESIDVVRMDLEGYEAEVLAGMSDTLSAPGPRLLFVECHPWLWESGGLSSVLSAFSENGYDLLSAVYNRTVLDVECIDDIADFEGHPELILRKHCDEP